MGASFLLWVGLAIFQNIWKETNFNTFFFSFSLKAWESCQLEKPSRVPSILGMVLCQQQAERADRALVIYPKEFIWESRDPLYNPTTSSDHIQAWGPFFSEIFLSDILSPVFTSHAFHLSRHREFIRSLPTGTLTTPPRTPNFHLSCRFLVLLGYKQ